MAPEHAPSNDSSLKADLVEVRENLVQEEQVDRAAQVVVLLRVRGKDRAANSKEK